MLTTSLQSLQFNRGLGGSFGTRDVGTRISSQVAQNLSSTTNVVQSPIFAIRKIGTSFVARQHEVQSHNKYDYQSRNSIMRDRTYTPTRASGGVPLDVGISMLNENAKTNVQQRTLDPPRSKISELLDKMPQGKEPPKIPKDTGFGNGVKINTNLNLEKLASPPPKQVNKTVLPRPDSIPKQSSLPATASKAWSA